MRSEETQRETYALPNGDTIIITYRAIFTSFGLGNARWSATIDSVELVTKKQVLLPRVTT